MIYLVISSLIGILIFIAWAWVEGITYMMDNHPDYRGEDLLDEIPKETECEQDGHHTKQNL